MGPMFSATTSVLLLTAVTASPAPVSSATPSPEADKTVAATVAGVPIYLEDVDRALGREAYLLKKNLYDLRIQLTNSLIEKRLLSREAAARKISEAALIEQLVANAGSPTPDEIDAEWAANVSALRSLGEVTGKYRISQGLAEHKRTEALRLGLEDLKKTADIRIDLHSPETFLDARPTLAILGNPNAPVTVTIFSDYECPYCRNLDRQLSDLLLQEPFKSNVRVAIKHFPLPSHPGAARAAQAAVCALAQGRFPQMHRLLFEQHSHDDTSLFQAASSASLDLPSFKICLSFASTGTEVSNDVSDARANDVTGTPSVFVDGIQLTPPGYETLNQYLHSAIKNAKR